MKKTVEIKHLHFITDKEILSDISWDFYAGERWVILGANGAGKTSLISTICAYNTPSSGELIVDGKRYSSYDWQKVREKIALVGDNVSRRIEPQELVLDAVVSGKFAMINYWGKITKSLATQAMRNLKRLGIAYLAQNYWGRISQGERVKVLIARALMVSPKILFLDEPCSGLDPLARKNFLEFLGELSGDKKIPAIAMATHHVEEIPQSFTNALILKGGRVLAAGPIKEVMTSKVLSAAYGAKCALKNKNGVYALEIK